MRRLLILAAIAVTSCRGACDEGGPAPAPTHKTLVLGTLFEPDTLDPVFSEIGGAKEIVRLLFRDLTQFDDRGQIVPGLAIRVPTATTSTTGRMRVRWQLRRDVAWSDGRPITASDVIFGHQIEGDPRLEVRAQSHAARVEAMRAIDAHELEVIWREPNVDYAAPQVHAVLPAHAYPRPHANDPPRVGFGRAPITSGPYRLKAWIPGQRIELEPNPGWPAPRPEIERLVWRFFQSEDSFEAELRTGGIDALGEGSGLSIDRAQALGERFADSHVLEVTDSGVWGQLTVRLDDPIAGRIEVRRAIDRAIDRRALIDLTFDGRALPAWGCFPPRHLAYRPVPPREVDLELASAELDAAGFRRGPDGRRAKDGVPLALRLLIASGSDASARAAAYLQSRLGQIGLSIEIEAAPINVVLERMRSGKAPPLVLYAYKLRPDWDLVSLFQSSSASNYAHLRDDETDAHLSRAMVAVDRAAWAIELQAVEGRMIELLPSIPLWFRGSASLRPRWLEGWRPTGTNAPITWNAETWSARRPR